MFCNIWQPEKTPCSIRKDPPTFKPLKISEKAPLGNYLWWVAIFLPNALDELFKCTDFKGKKCMCDPDLEHPRKSQSVP